jgi:hypothetical protein
MSRRRSLPSKDWRCIVVCADGHPSGKLAALGYEPEDIWMPTSIEDINSGTERLVTRRGATVSAGGGWRPRSGWRPSQRTKVEETKPGGGTKTRLRCEQCGRDVPISWDTLNLVAGTLHQHNVARLELADLEAMLKGNSREAGPS